MKKNNTFVLLLGGGWIVSQIDLTRAQHCSRCRDHKWEETSNVQENQAREEDGKSRKKGSKKNEKVR
jgi:hypothetical protein